MSTAAQPLSAALLVPYLCVAVKLVAVGHQPSGLTCVAVTEGLERLRMELTVTRAAAGETTDDQGGSPTSLRPPLVTESGRSLHHSNAAEDFEFAAILLAAYRSMVVRPAPATAMDELRANQADLAQLIEKLSGVQSGDAKDAQWMTELLDVVVSGLSEPQPVSAFE